MTYHTDISLGNHTAYSQYINFTSNYANIQHTYEEWHPAPDYSDVVVNFRLENDTIDDHVVLDGGRWLEMMYEPMSMGQPVDDDDLTCDDVQTYTETTALETTTNGDGIMHMQITPRQALVAA